MTNARFMLDLMKSSCTTYVGHGRHRHSFSDLGFMRLLNLIKDPKLCTRSGASFHTLGGKCLID